MSSEAITVRVADRDLRLTNLGKELYPESGFTKGEVIEYYVAVADYLLPQLRGRPVTLYRSPDGVAGESFFEKNVPGHAPPWIRTAWMPTPGSTRGNETSEFVLVEDLPSLVWVANLASLELHVPQWRINSKGGRRHPDLLVFDLDPGAPATVVECCEVALLIRELLAEDGLPVFPKTSGSKGMQLYAPVNVRSAERTSEYAKRIAERLAAKEPRRVVAAMAKAARTGKVFVDWSQNNPYKTTIAPYSLRTRPRPTVSTPVTWDEVASCRSVADLTFTAADVRARLDEHGDLLAGLHDRHYRLPA